MTHEEMIKALLENMVGLDIPEAVGGPTAHKQRSSATEAREQMRAYSNMSDANFTSSSKVQSAMKDVIKWMYGAHGFNKSSPQNEKQLNAIPPPSREKCERFRRSQFARIAKGGLFAHQKLLTESQYQYK